jgi:dihydroneopterin aldolase
MAVNINTAVHYDEACWVWQKSIKEPRQKATKDLWQQVASIFVSANVKAAVLVIENETCTSFQDVRNCF